MPASSQPAFQESCGGGWYAVAPLGYVCVETNVATTDVSHPIARALTRRPDASSRLPYMYGLVHPRADLLAATDANRGRAQGVRFDMPFAFVRRDGAYAYEARGDQWRYESRCDGAPRSSLRARSKWSMRAATSRRPMANGSRRRIVPASTA